ncbi:MAG: type II toxin-antitoxin system RatA family toxin [Gammaproteobacteria bacterium]|nr:type II toxin-antitoxin system RatA family toxin [Gammaproteobacteria bacterium]
MREVNRSALVPHSAEAMFDLVNDVARYPEFLPWCRSSRVVEESDSHMIATIEVAKGGIHQSFTTRNTLERPTRLQLQLENGPFRHLKGEWRFEPLDENACKVELHLEFEFSNRLISMAFGPVFNQVCESMLDAFVKRARQLDG